MVYVKADIASFHIAEVVFNDTTYYLKFAEHFGILKKDYCFYNHQNEYIGEVDEWLDAFLYRPHIEVYQELHLINTVKLATTELPDTLYVLKKPTQKTFTTQYTLNKVFKGNIYGYIYSDKLNAKDNYWISDYPIERYLCMSSEEGFCNFCLYGIKGNLLDTEKENIQTKLTAIKDKTSKEFKAYINELYEKNILMIGSCSC